MNCRRVSPKKDTPGGTAGGGVRSFGSGGRAGGARRVVTAEIELLVKLGEGCGDERTFVGKVKEMTEVLGRRRGLIQDLHDGAIDLDTLIQDAARGNAARGNGVRV